MSGRFIFGLLVGVAIAFGVMFAASFVGSSLDKTFEGVSRALDPNGTPTKR